ncbi:MAG: hypothetical protein ABSB82_13120 [Terriglobia bacterium]|jgi:hypothetical protein
MTARKAIEIGFKTIVLAIGLTIIFMIGAMVAGMAKAVPATAGTATATAPAGQPGNFVLWLFVASLIQTIVVTYLVLESKWSGWKTTGALFLVVLNMWAQTAIESAPYLRGHVSSSMSARALAMGLLVATVFAPFAVWVLGGFARAPREAPSERVHWSVARWVGTLAATTGAFIALYYLCGYYIAWQNPALRQFYSGTTEIRSFWGQIAWTWSSTPWMFPFQAGRALLFVALTLPAIRMLRGGAQRVALGTALMYAAWDGSPGLILPNPIMSPTIAHTHAVELAVWGLLFGAFVGWMMSRGRAAAPVELQIPKAA